MTLSMSNKLEESYSGQYQQTQNQQQAHCRETIHSGQFMVSHFEAEAQDDDDGEFKIPDPDDDPILEKVSDVELCTDLQRYVPQQTSRSGSRIVTSRLEIETTLTKLFKCLNLAYSQKLTSPKWNHFKGIRLRWKDKIRLNNVIWRCWHMQFILKKRTPVCQFASPLDVDIHSNPESVVLEGKYWKRQVSVIKAEYRKWRRNFKTKAIGHSSISDIKSELDFLEWSPLTNDRNLMLTEDWTSDTLFSAINGPFPFPDPREIARGAGIADFIQPSLGPLQPNLDDIDITFQELLQNHRLPTVPEEVTEDIFKSVDYNNFPAIMGTEQMDSANITDVTNSVQPADLVQQMDDSNMLELNTPLNAIQYTGKLYAEPIGIQQQAQAQPQPQQTSRIINTQDVKTLQVCPSTGFESSLIEGTTQTQPMLVAQKQNSTLNNFNLGSIGQINNSDMSLVQTTNQINNSIFSNSGKNILKGRVSKPASRPFRREPHNYDKAQPTLHQTNIYQKMLAEQQQQQQQQQQQSHNQSSQPMLAQIQFAQQFPNATTTLNANNFQTQTSNILNIPSTLGNIQCVKSFTMSPGMQPMTIINQKITTPQSDIMSILNATNTGQDTYKTSSVHQVNPQSTSYQPYPAVTQNFKKAASTAGFINISSRNMRQPSPTRSQQNSLLTEQQQQTAKEMFRSNSLPLNSSLQNIQPKEETFVMPRLHLKTHRSRSRSNSQQSGIQTGPPLLQTANSEPLLNVNNSTLAQLLTTNNTTKLSNKHSSSTSAIHSHSLPPSGFNNSAFNNTNNLQIQQSTQPQQHVSPTRTQSLPHSLMIHSPPGANQMVNFSPNPNPQTSTPSLSPDSFAEQDSPLSPTRAANTSNNLKYPKDPQRRAGHIHAEQKRRYNIKNGFDTLHSLIPQLNQNPNPKLSKAAMLQKGAEYIKQLRGERSLLNEKMDALRKERDSLNISLAHLHSILPVNGAPISRQRTERVQQLYNQYVCYRARENWKFWILGLILEPLVSSYTTTVSTASMEELYRTALLWVDKHCSLVDLRPAVSNKLRYLSTTTDILSDPPSTLRDEVMRAINNPIGKHPNLSSS